MLKLEDLEYKSRFLTADTTACAIDRESAHYGISFGILTGVEGLVDQFELDDARNGEDATIAMKRMVWGTSSRT